MKNTFSHLLPSSLDTIKNRDEVAIKDAVVVVDTNVLLDLYRRTPAAQEARFRALEALGDRLMVPHQVGLEFYRGRADVADELAQAFKKANAAIQSMEVALAAFGKPHFPEVRDHVTKAGASAGADLRAKLKAIDAADLTVTGLDSDELLPRIEGLLNGRVLTAPSARKVRERVERFVNYRVPNKVPPGYADAGKETAVAAAGDYLIWCELLAFARKDGRPVLFVTNDGKDDWWLKGNRRTPEQALPALIGEFGDHSKAAYHQIKFTTFFSKVEELLDVPVSAEVLAEETEADAALSAAAAQSRAESLYRDMSHSTNRGKRWVDELLASEVGIQELRARYPHVSRAQLESLEALNRMAFPMAALDKGMLSPLQRLSPRERAAIRGALSDPHDASLLGLAQQIAAETLSFDDIEPDGEVGTDETQ